MAKLVRTLVSHNLHALAIQFEEALLDGWKMDRSITARRSLGNKFSIVLYREVERVETVKKVEAQEAEVVAKEEVETEVETKVEDQPEVKVDDEVVETATKAKSAAKAKTTKAKAAE